MSTTTEFLHEHVYPNLDAVSAELLAHLNPRNGKGGSNSYYSLDCPHCQKAGRAYYYPGTSSIVCNRKNADCPSTSIWDAVEVHYSSNKDIFNALCEAANVEPPGREDNISDEQRTRLKLKKVIIAICQKAHKEHQPAMDYLAGRNFKPEEIQHLGYGYYPSHGYIKEQLLKASMDIKIAQEWGLIPGNPDKFWGMNGRFVGFWEQPDGSIRLWGRLMREPKGREPKYLFAEGMNKSRPYRWQKTYKKMPILVEGTLDADSLQLMGYPGFGVGQYCINVEQAKFLLSQQIYEVIHFADADNAGLEGAIKSIRNCEPLGITVYVVFVAPQYEDADKMRQRGQQDKMKEFIDSAVIAGEFLAYRVLDTLQATESGKLSNEQYAHIYQDAILLRSTMTGASALAFDGVFIRYGITAFNPEAEAMKLQATLLQANLDPTLVSRVVRDRFGIELDVVSMNELERASR